MNPRLRRVGVIGDPVKHSLSPIIHQRWMYDAKLDEKKYEAIPIPPDDLTAFLGSLAGDGFAGCNVTVPHKEAVFSYIESYGVLDKKAKRARSVNLIVIDRNGKMQGKNTDGYGFTKSLCEREKNCLQYEKAVVLGAGGAARAILAELQDSKVGSIAVVNRTREKSWKLLEELQISKGKTFNVNKIHTAIKDANLLINTTSLGMRGKLSLEEGFKVNPWEILRGLAHDAVVVDIVYDPLQTKLLQAAKKQGLIAIDGLGMLMHQAVPSFEAWFGVRPEVTPELRARLEDELRARGSLG